MNLKCWLFKILKHTQVINFTTERQLKVKFLIKYIPCRIIAKEKLSRVDDKILFLTRVMKDLFSMLQKGKKQKVLSRFLASLSFPAHCNLAFLVLHFL